MKNIYKVNKRKWNKWSARARAVFNTTFKTITGDPWVFNLDGLGKRTVRVTAWNVAWIAADACDGERA